MISKNNIKIPEHTYKRVRELFPSGNLIVNPDYYEGAICPRTSKVEICHSGNGNLGYICPFYSGFYPGDIGITICNFGIPIQLELF